MTDFNGGAVVGETSAEETKVEVAVEEVSAEQVGINENVEAPAIVEAEVISEVAPVTTEEKVEEAA